MNLDLKDRKILYQLDINSRQPNSVIGKKVGLSKEVVKYRINRLKKLGIIKNFITVLNDYSLDYHTYRIYIKFRDLSHIKEERIVNYLKNKVKWLVKTRGNWSFCFTVITKNVLAIEELINDIKNRFSKDFVKLSFSIITRVYNFQKNFLIKHKIYKSNYSVMGEVVKKYKADEIDIKILKILQDNARINSVDIAELVNSNNRVVRYRIKRLIKNKVIIGFKVLLNFEKINYNLYKIHMKYKKFNKGVIKEIHTYLHNHPNIIRKIDAIGGFDLEFEIIAINNNELYKTLDDFINQFIGIIEDYHILEYEKKYKLSYLNEI